MVWRAKELIIFDCHCHEFDVPRINYCGDVWVEILGHDLLSGASQDEVSGSHEGVYPISALAEENLANCLETCDQIVVLFENRNQTAGRSLADLSDCGFQHQVVNTQMCSYDSLGLCEGRED
jgi:hypothetical protein